MKRVWIIGLLALFAVGCVRSRPIIKYTKLRDLPTFSAVELEQLSEETRNKLIEKDEKLKSHVLTLEAKIDKYNEYARKSHR